MKKPKPSKPAALPAHMLVGGVYRPVPPLAVKPGDVVAYSAKFLRSTGMVVGPWGQKRGQVVEVVGDRFARIAWTGEPEPRLVNLCNLAKPGPNLRFAAD